MNKLETQTISTKIGGKLKSTVLTTTLALSLVLLPGLSNGQNSIKLEKPDFGWRLPIYLPINDELPELKNPTVSPNESELSNPTMKEYNEDLPNPSINNEKCKCQPNTHNQNHINKKKYYQNSQELPELKNPTVNPNESELPNPTMKENNEDLPNSIINNKKSKCAPPSIHNNYNFFKRCRPNDELPELPNPTIISNELDLPNPTMKANNQELLIPLDDSKKIELPNLTVDSNEKESENQVILPLELPFPRKPIIIIPPYLPVIIS